MVNKVQNSKASAARQKTPGASFRTELTPLGVNILKRRHHRIEAFPIGLLRDNINDRTTIKALALAFAVKAMFKSSLLRDATYAKISDMFGISRAKAKEYITILDRLGLIERQGEDILFKGFRHAGKYKFTSIQDYSNINITDLREVEKYLRLQAVKIKQSQIDYAINKLNALIDPNSLAAYKRAKRNTHLREWGGKIDRGQSIKTVSKTSGLSNGSAVRLLEWGEAKGLLKKEKRVVRVAFYPTQEEVTEHDFHCSYFYHHGKRYRAESTILHFG